MLKKFFLFLSFCPVFLYSQNEVDALRYSQLGISGTARFTSMAGAFGALGGDVSALSYNPAGIGIYRKSEFNFTPSLYTKTISSIYNGTTSGDIKYAFNFSNVALVATKLREKNDENNAGWVTSSLGLAFNRTNNFASRTNIIGHSDRSMLNVFAKNADGLYPDELDDFAEGMAYDLALIRKDSATNTYYSNIPEGVVIAQTKQIETSGGMSEFAISYGGNYANKLYVGGSLCFPRLRYTEISSFVETDDEDEIADLNYYKYDYDLTTTGSGVNLKLGLIYRINDWFRIGGAFHTPTFWGLKDSYSSHLTVSDPNYSTLFIQDSPAGIFDYSLTTPMRAIASAGFVIKKRGLIGIDYEYLNYANARLSSSPNVFNEQNGAISSKYIGAANIRIGSEWRFDPFSVRLGYALYGSPYTVGVGNKSARNTYTFGAGVKGQGFYVDGAYIFTGYSDKYYMYEGANPVNNTHSSSGFMATVGFKF
jgi:hypothetical protein